MCSCECVSTLCVYETSILLSELLLSTHKSGWRKTNDGPDFKGQCWKNISYTFQCIFGVCAWTYFERRWARRLGDGRWMCVLLCLRVLGAQKKSNLAAETTHIFTAYNPIQHNIPLYYIACSTYWHCIYILYTPLAHHAYIAWSSSAWFCFVMFYPLGKYFKYYYYTVNKRRKRRKLKEQIDNAWSRDAVDEKKDAAQGQMCVEVIGKWSESS